MDSKRVSWRERIKHFTYAWFCMTMSTGGIALLISLNPHKFRGMETIGTIVFIFDLVVFTILTGIMITRCVMNPGTFTAAFYHPIESLFIPTFLMSLAIILCNIEEYGSPSSGSWLTTVCRVLFWIYVAVSLLVAILHYYFLFTHVRLNPSEITPAWLLPAFPVMLSGVVASSVATPQPPQHAIPIIIAGITFQTLGMFVSVFAFGIYLARLFSNGLPNPVVRPAMFISVGPPSFTGLAYIGVADNALQAFPHTFVVGTDDLVTAQVLKIVGTFFAIGLWSMAFWFFCLSAIGSFYAMRQTTFHLCWWSLVFPNTGFILLTIKIGQAIDSRPILWITSGVTCIHIVVYLLILFAHMRAIWKEHIMWPGKDEDRPLN